MKSCKCCWGGFLKSCDFSRSVGPPVFHFVWSLTLESHPTLDRMSVWVHLGHIKLPKSWWAFKTTPNWNLKRILTPLLKKGSNFIIVEGCVSTVGKRQIISYPATPGGSISSWKLFKSRQGPRRLFNLASKHRPHSVRLFLEQNALQGLTHGFDYLCFDFSIPFNACWLVN